MRHDVRRHDHQRPQQRARGIGICTPALGGHAMARSGRVGAALTIAAAASLAGASSQLPGSSLSPSRLPGWDMFGSPEVFALVLVGFSLLLSISGDSMVKGGIVALFGLAMSPVGLDRMCGAPRLTFGKHGDAWRAGHVPAYRGFSAFSKFA